MIEAATVTPRDLPRKPLVEAIFELRWTLQEVQPGVQHDPAFRFLLGRFYDKVRREFPFVQDLPATQVPEEIAAYTVRHQFRPRAEAWPVLQLGPGVLTVNETKAYTWDAFSKHVARAIEALFEAYPRDLASVSSPLKPVEVKLRYINVVKYQPAEMPPLTFLRERLHIHIDVDDPAFRATQKVTSANAASLNLTIPLEDLPGAGAVLVATGQQNGSSIVRWETIIASSGAQAPHALTGLASWLEKAHAIAEEWFFTLARGQLLEEFSKKE